MCFTFYLFHAVLMLVSSVSIAMKLTLVVRSKRELTQISYKSGEKRAPGRVAAGSRCKQQSQCAHWRSCSSCRPYLPTAVCLAYESPQLALVRLNHLTITTMPEIVHENRIIKTIFDIIEGEVKIIKCSKS